MAANRDPLHEYRDSAGAVGAAFGTGRAATEAHRQSATIAASKQEPEDQAFVDAISSDWDTEG